MAMLSYRSKALLLTSVAAIALADDASMFGLDNPMPHAHEGDHPATAMRSSVEMHRTGFLSGFTVHIAAPITEE